MNVPHKGLDVFLEKSLYISDITFSAHKLQGLKTTTNRKILLNLFDGFFCDLDVIQPVFAVVDWGLNWGIIDSTFLEGFAEGR